MELEFLFFEEGPKFGDFPEPDKSYLVVHPDFMDKAKEHFKDFNINIVTAQRFLGGLIGWSIGTEIWLQNKITSWLQAISSVTAAAVDYPQAAFISFTKSLQNEWSFIQRVLLGFETQFSMLKEAIKNEFLSVGHLTRLGYYADQLTMLELVFLILSKQHFGNIQTQELQQKL